MIRRRRIGIALAALSIALSQSLSNAAGGQTAAVAPSEAKGSRCNRAKFRVILDVGHTLEDPGAISARGVPEYEFNLRLAQQIEQKLLGAGFGRTLLLITGGPAVPGLVQRVAVANKSTANLFLSIHHDSVPDRFLENWEFEGKPSHFSDRFPGHSIFVSYENRESCVHKVNYVREKNLGGIMIWELGGGYFHNEQQQHPLLDAIKKAVDQ